MVLARARGLVQDLAAMSEAQLGGVRADLSEEASDSVSKTMPVIVTGQRLACLGKQEHQLEWPLLEVELETRSETELERDSEIVSREPGLEPGSELGSEPRSEKKLGAVLEGARGAM